MEILKKLKDKLTGGSSATSTLHIGQQSAMLWDEPSRSKKVLTGSPQQIPKILGDHGIRQIKRLVLAPEFYELHLLDQAPDVPKDALDEALQWHMAELMNRDGTELLVRHFPCFTPESHHASGKFYAAVAIRSELKHLIDSLEAENLASIEINELSIARWQAEQESTDKSSVLIAIELSNINLYFFVNDHFYFKRQILGHDPNQLIDTIQRTLGFCHSNFDAPEVTRVFVTEHDFCQTLSQSLDLNASFYFVNTFHEHADEQTPERAIALAAYHPLSVEVSAL